MVQPRGSRLRSTASAGEISSPLAHDVPHRELTRAGPAHQARNLLARGAHDPHLTREENARSAQARDRRAPSRPPGESATTLRARGHAWRVRARARRPSSCPRNERCRRRAGRDGPRASCRRPRASRGPMPLGYAGSAVVARQRRCDHLVARDEIRKHWLPVAPMAGEPVEENHRLAPRRRGTGTMRSRPWAANPNAKGGSMPAATFVLAPTHRRADPATGRNASPVGSVSLSPATYRSLATCCRRPGDGRDRNRYQ